MWNTGHSPRHAPSPEWAEKRVAEPQAPIGPAVRGPVRVIASLSRIDLARRCRRELGIGIWDHTALAVTDDALLVLTRRDGRTRLAARYPRHAAVVTDFRTLPLGGDFLADRVVIEVGDVAIRGDFDGRLHRDAERVVAALGGIAPAR